MAKQIVIIRHGETEWNKTRRFQGQTDVPLNEEGRRQAADLAIALDALLPFDRIVSSDLVRAKETAEIMSRMYPTEIVADSGFREMDFGQWEGLTIQEIRGRWPDALEEWFSTGRLRVPGGETQEQLYNRVWERFLYWADQPDYTKLAVVCHGGSCGMILCGVLGRPPHEMSKYMPKNTSISQVAVLGPGVFSLEQMGDLLR